MLNENIKKYRQQKGMSQEEVAARLNVVRQTISKWEKGYSVPDSAMLIKLAEVLDVSVAELLGDESSSNNEMEKNEIAQQLERINEQMAVKNRRTKNVLKAIAIIIVAAVVIRLAAIALFTVNVSSTTEEITVETEYEE